MDQNHPLFDVDTVDQPNRRSRPSARSKREKKRQQRNLTRARKCQRELKFRRFLDERKNKFNVRNTTDSKESNKEVWTSDDVRKLHVGTLEASLSQINQAVPGTALFEDLAAWFMESAARPFSFVACCALTGSSPDDVREQALLRLLASAVSCSKREGKRGEKARAWIQGQAVGSVTFATCCEAVGYSPATIRNRLAA